jgi:hypothetical protein
MRKTLGLLIVLGLAATPALAQKVNIDYAHDFDFEKAKSFQYVETKDSNSDNQRVDDRIKNAILRELKEGGMQQVESDPDLFITYHITTKENTVYNTTSMGYGGYGGFYGGWGGWGGMGMGSSTTTASTFTEGTLIIDAYEPQEKKMVWRGMGTVTIKAKPEKQTAQIDKILTKIGAKWEKILKNQGE